MDHRPHRLLKGALGSLLAIVTMALTGSLAWAASVGTGPVQVADGTGTPLASYSTLAKAFSALSAEELTAPLTGDTFVVSLQSGYNVLVESEQISLTENRSVTLDLQGKTVTLGIGGAQSDLLSLTVNDGTLIIKDSVGGGKIAASEIASGASTIYVNKTGDSTPTIIMQGGTIENQNGGPAIRVGEGNITMSDGTLTRTQKAVSGADGSLTYKDGLYSALSVAAGNNTCDALVSGGTIEGGITVGGKGNLTITGGTITANDFAVCTNGSFTPKATITIKDGTITGDLAALYTPNSKANEAAPNEILIEGGTLTGAVGIGNLGSNITITGGTITATGTNAGYQFGDSGETFPPAAVSSIENPKYGTPTQDEGEGYVSVTGGTLNSQPGYPPVYEEDEAEGATSVSGGTFNQPLPPALLEGDGKDAYAVATQNGYSYFCGDQAKEEAQTFAQQKQGVVLSVDQESGALTNPDSTPTTPTITAYGFSGNYDELTSADAAINEALGTTNVTYVPEGETNIMWAVIKGIQGDSYGAMVSYTGANEVQEIPFTTGGNEPDHTDAATVTITSPSDLQVVWFAMGNIEAPSNTNAQPPAGAENGTAMVQAGFPKSGAYQVSVWPANSYTTVQAAKSEPFQVTGVAFSLGKGATQAPPKMLFGMAGSMILLPSGLTPTNPNDALSGWDDGETIHPAGSAYTVPEPPSPGQNITLNAVWGVRITLHAVPTTLSKQFPTGSGVFVTNAGEPLPGTTDSTQTLTLGASEAGAVPALPYLEWAGPQSATGAAASWDAAAFVGWYAYADAAYTLYEEDADLTITQPVDLYPLFAPLTLSWTPATGILMPNQTQTYELSTTVNTTALTEALKLQQLDVSTPCTNTTNDLINTQLTAPVEDDQESSTGLANITFESQDDCASVAAVEDVAHAFAVTGLKATPEANPVTLSAMLPFFNNLSAKVSIVILPALTINVSPSDSAGQVAQTVNAQGSITLTANPAEGFTFVRWLVNGNEVSKNPVFVVGENPAQGIYTAVFAAVEPEPSTPEGQVPVYRLYNPYLSGAHLLTTDNNEVRVLTSMGWQLENAEIAGGVRFYEYDLVGAPEGVATQPVYRLYNSYNGDHFYTANPNEYRDLCQVGWTGEGQKFSAPTQEGIAVYRLYNSYQTELAGLGNHLWTPDQNEVSTLTNIYGWTDESIAWHAVSLPES